jgi:VWFA-related protein
MPRFTVRLIPARLISALVSVGCLTLPCAAQSPALKPVSQQAPARPPVPSLTLRTYSRMVTLEVVVKDAKGNHVTGLKPEDFQLFEQTQSKGKAKREQKIATFREVSMADMTVHNSGLAAQIPAGVYTNVVSSLRDPVPSTVILVDGLNTDVEYQGRVHAAMLKMLQQLPPDVPVAVFLLGRRLVMLQDFTSDPKLLQAALGKAITADGRYMAPLDPRDDPESIFSELSSLSAPIPGEMLDAAQNGDARVYGQNMDVRASRTEDALISIARHMSGYPGRKNLLWMSTAFPISIDPLLDQSRDHDYKAGVQQVASALSDSRIAVYPVNVAGGRTLNLFEAEIVPSPETFYGQLMKEEIRREEQLRFNEQETMHAVADGTGGAICVGDNDLADCVHRAVDDSSEFYEIAYYPDSKDWNGEYRRIVLDTKVKGLHLEYRQGYFATLEGSNETAAKDELQKVACGSALDATAIFLAARNLPPNPKQTMKFYLMINPAALTFAAAGRGSREVSLRVGVCTFDETGKPLHYMSEGVDQKLTAKEFAELAKGGLPHLVAMAGPKPAAVRLAVMDEPSGKVGSVFVKTGGPVIAATAGSRGTDSSPQDKK